MANYLLAFHGGGMPETPEEQQAVMTAWMAWYGTLGDSVVDGGNPHRADEDHRRRRLGERWRRCQPAVGLRRHLGR